MTAEIYGALPLLAFVLLVAMATWCLLDRLSPNSKPDKMITWEAEVRSERLLQNVLGINEYRKMTAQGKLEIESPNFPHRVYVIPAWGGQVLVLDKDRKMVEWLCVQPVEKMPKNDRILMHKLLIEGDEFRYLRTANHFVGTGTTRME